MQIRAIVSGVPINRPFPLTVYIVRYWFRNFIDFSTFGMFSLRSFSKLSKTKLSEWEFKRWSCTFLLFSTFHLNLPSSAKSVAFILFYIILAFIPTKAS